MRAPALRMGVRYGRITGAPVASGIALECSHFGACPACDISERLEAPLLLEEARRFFNERGSELHPRWGSPHGYRTTAKLAVRRDPSTDQIVIGLFERRSHSVVAIPSCVVQHPSINRAAALIQERLRAHQGVTAYDDISTSGLLRYLQMGVQRCTGRVQLTLVANARTATDDAVLKELVEQLWPAGSSSELWHSIWVNVNTMPNNIIFSHELGAWKLMCGERLLVEEIKSGSPIALLPYTFRQPNLDGFEGVIRTVVEAVPRGARVVEWYSGVGVLGLALVRRSNVRWVRCSDISPRCAFDMSCGMLPEGMRSQICYDVGPAGRRVSDAIGADVAVVDPPRKGLDPELIDALCATKPRPARMSKSKRNGSRSGGGATAPEHEQEVLCAPTQEATSETSVGSSLVPIGPCRGLKLLVYVSCGFQALQRDADALLSAGWSVRRAEAHMLMMGTNHLETVVEFERLGGAEAIATAGAQWAANATTEDAKSSPKPEGRSHRAFIEDLVSPRAPADLKPKNKKRAEKLRARRERSGRQRRQSDDDLDTDTNGKGCDDVG